MLWKKLKFYKIILILIIIFLPGCAFKGYLRELSSEEYSKHNYEEMISSEYLNQLNIKEELFYKVYWTGIPAGKVSLKIKATESYHDFKVCKISAFAETNKLFSVIYNIKDVFDSYIDSKDFFSRGYFLNRQGRNSKKRKSVL